MTCIELTLHCKSATINVDHREIESRAALRAREAGLLVSVAQEDYYELC